MSDRIRIRILVSPWAVAHIPRPLGRILLRRCLTGSGSWCWAHLWQWHIFLGLQVEFSQVSDRIRIHVLRLTLGSGTYSSASRSNSVEKVSLRPCRFTAPLLASDIQREDMSLMRQPHEIDISQAKSALKVNPNPRGP